MKRTALIPLIFPFFISSHFAAKSQAVNVQDSIALVNFYDSTNGIAWANHQYWLTSFPVSMWRGVKVKNGRVDRLAVYGQRISGVLPASLGNLTAITYIDLSNNAFTGAIPASLGNLDKLTYLDLSNNQLSDSMPRELGNLLSLQTVILNSNKFTGPIPSFLYTLPNLTNIDLSYNKLSGSIPPEFGNSAKLENLDLAYNNLSGNILLDLSRVTTLTRLRLGGNNLSGSIPPELGNLTGLSHLSLEQTRLGGTIPAELGNFHNLTYLNLSSNLFNGNVPASFSSFHNLTFFSLAGCGLSGTFPNMNDNVASCNVYINNNFFTYDGLEQYFVIRPGWTKYAPQAVIPLIKNGNNLSVAVGGTLANDTFWLYKDSKLFATQVGDSVFTINTAGAYSIIARNKIARSLLLHSEEIYVATLPLTVLNFTAAVKNAATVLQWQTANEVNTSRFIVQRSNGSMFTPIGIVNAANTNSNHTNAYNFTDASPLQSNNIYRLKMVDKDGTFTYSKTISVTVSKGASGLNIYPNLVRSNATVTFNSNAGKYTLTISNSNGGRVKQLTGFAAQGVNSVPVDMSGLAKGLYIITLDNGTDKYSVKLVKE